jgi:hypothetical protein
MKHFVEAGSTFKEPGQKEFCRRVTFAFAFDVGRPVPGSILKELVVVDVRYILVVQVQVRLEVGNSSVLV